MMPVQYTTYGARLGMDADVIHSFLDPTAAVSALLRALLLCGLLQLLCFDKTAAVRIRRGGIGKGARHIPACSTLCVLQQQHTAYDCSTSSAGQQPTTWWGRSMVCTCNYSWLCCSLWAMTINKNAGCSCRSSHVL